MRPDLLRELGVLVRDGEFLSVENLVAEHAAELAPLLGTTAAELHALAAHGDDAPRLLGRLLDRARGVRAQRRRQDAAAIAEKTAADIGASARFFELGVVVDIDLVLGKLLADPSRKHIAFVLLDDVVVIEATLLRRARILRQTFMDAVCFIDEKGVHFRWKGGRGKLNLHTQVVGATELQNALVVLIPPPMRPEMPALISVSAE